MKSYKDFAKESIGSSDIGALVLVGGGAGDIQNQFLFFGEDGSYRAYMVTGADVEKENSLLVRRSQLGDRRESGFFYR